MPPCPSDEAALRTSNKDYTVILLYGVCQGQRKGQFFVRGHTIPPFSFSQPPSQPLPGSHSHAGASCKPKEFLVSSLSQDGSPAVPGLIDFPHSLNLLPGCEFHHSSKEKAVQGRLSALRPNVPSIWPHPVLPGREGLFLSSWDNEDP